MKILQSTLITFLLLVSLSACHHKNVNSDAQRTDSLLREVSDSLFTASGKTDSLLQKMQSTISDSSCWYRLQVFRGTAQQLMGDSEKSARTYRQVEGWCRRTPGSHNVEGLLWNHRGVNYTMEGNVEKGGVCYQRAFSLLNRPPKTKELISTTANLADNYMQTGDLPRAASYYRYALLLCDSLGEGSNRTAIYSGLGQTYMDMGLFTEAHHFFSLAGQAIGREDLQTRFFYYFSMGSCYYFEDRYAEAISMFHRAGQLAAQSNSPHFQLACNGNLAEVYLMADSLKEAHKYLANCEALIKKNPDMPMLTVAYVESLMADLALAEGRIVAAQAFLKNNIDSLLAQSPRYLMLHYRRLERYAILQQQWEKAYYYRDRAESYTDSLHNMQSRRAVIDIGMRYRRDTILLSQKLYLSDLKEHNARQKGFIYLFILVTALLALGGTIAILIYRRRTQRRFKRQMEKMTELRMEIVRNRVSPHYVFNVLGTILPRLQGHPDIMSSIELLIDVLRGNLLASDRVAVPLADEMSLVRSYVTMHHYCNGGRPMVTWETDSNLFHEKINVLSMALQIPVENALKHAFPILTDKSAIHIAVKKKDGGLLLSVTDNGCGYNPGKVAPTGRDTGTGLRLLSRTIAILNQYNQHPATLSITNMSVPQCGTCVCVYLPSGYIFSLYEKN